MKIILVYIETNIENEKKSYDFYILTHWSTTNFLDYVRSDIVKCMKYIQDMSYIIKGAID